MASDLHGCTVLVTGASRGIGRALALGFAEAGADIVAVGRSAADLEALARDVQQGGRSCQPLIADLMRLETLPNLAREAWSWREKIDALVNAAGILIRKEPAPVTSEEWDEVFGTNTRAPFFLAQELCPLMREAGGGAIVNITSLAGQKVTRAPMTYQASKAALIQLTRALAVRWAPTVRVNAVGPGYIQTHLNEDWLAVSENRAYVEGRTPLGRIGQPQDVVGAAIFLASAEAAFITGQHLLVDGGWSVQ